jgi:L-alanine-DL-glutamate epimerase-like enolase superfamily enzyme
MFLNLTLDELLQEAEQIREQGFRYAKMRVGRPTLREDAERVRAVQQALGDEIRLMIDCSRAFDAGQAIRLGRELEER